MTSRINHLAVFVAAIAYFAWGAVWFTIFGLKWASLVGLTPEQARSSGWVPYLVSFLMGWILSYVVGIALKDTTHPQPARHGIEFGIFMSVGVYATMLLNQYIYEQRPLMLWLIDAGYVVIGMAIIGAIVGAWRKRA